MYFAHSQPGRPTNDWEILDVHLTEVSSLAALFSTTFNAEKWGRLAGLWHDLGKLQPDFQRYIRGETLSGPPHAWLGAVFALMQDGRAGLPLAAAIAAHHGSLSNIKPDDANGIPSGGTLADRIQLWKTQSEEFKALLPPPSSLPPLPAYVSASTPDSCRVELFTRFLFSVLIDADRTATAKFYAQFIPQLTADDLCFDGISTLAARLDAAIDAMPPKGSPSVIELRRQVLAACRQKAIQPPGRFSLTVPTGGGKTLSAMSFALNHAKINALRRVIVVIPYTSITEQSARVYGEILNRPGMHNVLEHHSNLDEQKRSEQDARGENLRKLAAENWNAPVIVTTTVQFFESLLAAHGSRCRKVHNIAKSVILLDEVQTLPPHYLETILNLLTQLTDGYGCSVVLSTATPPALRARPGATHAGLGSVQEIMPDPSTLAAAAKRVNIEWRIDRVTPYAELAIELREHRSVVAIVHRRDDAQTLANAIGDDVLHLSAAMCPAHRLAVLTEVRRRLTAGDPCRLVSTQLIEAGVDVDFPIVYRSLAGLDSIAQSAGRCDREGKLTEAAGAPAGRMIVFRAETAPPPGTLRKALESMDVLLKLGKIDPFEPNDSLTFFDQFYEKFDRDIHRVQFLRRTLAFQEVADTFKMIDTDMYPIVVPYRDPSIDGAARIAAFLAQPMLQNSRALQPLTVQIPRYRRDTLRDALIIHSVINPANKNEEPFPFDILQDAQMYHPIFGFNPPRDPMAAPESLMV